VAALITALPASENAPGVFSTHPLPISTESGRLKSSENPCARAAGTAATIIANTIPARRALLTLIHRPLIAAWILFMALCSFTRLDRDSSRDAKEPMRTQTGEPNEKLSMGWAETDGGRLSPFERISALQPVLET